MIRLCQIIYDSFFFWLSLRSRRRQASASSQGVPRVAGRVGPQRASRLTTLDKSQTRYPQQNFLLTDICDAAAAAAEAAAAPCIMRTDEPDSSHSVRRISATFTYSVRYTALKNNNLIKVMFWVNDVTSINWEGS